MQSEDVKSIVRYLAAIGAGYLLKSGHISPAEVETIVGIVVGAAAIIASQIQRAKRRKAEAAAAPYQPSEF
jgi:hypothetical protein